MPSSDLILDIGTGSGRIARDIILKTRTRVIEIDVGYHPTSKLKRKEIYPDHYELVIADAQYLPFQDLLLIS